MDVGSGGAVRSGARGWRDPESMGMAGDGPADGANPDGPGVDVAAGDAGGDVSAEASPLPDPEPKPTAVPGLGALNDVEAAICAYPWPCAQAIAVAGCESGRDKLGHLDGWWASSGSSYGLFQINAIHAGRWPDFWSAWMTERNIAYAYEIWSEQGWRPWACRWAAR